MVAEWVLSTARADEVWMMPTAHHAFSKSLAPFEARVAMLKASIASLKGASVCEIENEREGVSYTIDTVDLLRARFPDARFLLVVGTDILADAPKWKQWDRLKTLVELVPVRRDGVQGSEVDDGTPLFPNLSSSSIRERISRGQDVDALVPAGALALIRTRGLYR